MVTLKTFPDTESLIVQTLTTLREIFPALGPKDGVMLAGGRTPLEIYCRAKEEDLSTGGIPFLSDERYVSDTNPQSNYGTISPMFGNLMRIPTELPLHDAAQAFHEKLSRLEKIPLGLLGLGADGHTASLFNLNDAAIRDFRLAIPVLKKEKPDRISVTAGFLHKVNKIIILATGEEKKAMIEVLLKKPLSIPAGVALTDHPDVEIWTDLTIDL